MIIPALSLLVVSVGHAAPAPVVYDPSWPRVLERFVDERGRVGFAAVKADPADLRAQTDFVAATAPEAVPEGAPRLAYLLNAYNALAMSHAAHSGLMPKSKVRFFFLSRHDVGGRRLSLHALENKVIRPLGDPRVHFALNCMVRGCPRLPREPFSPEILQAQLNRAAVEFFGERRHVQVDEAARVVRFSAILDWYKEDFLAAAPSLISYANRFRESKIPEDFKVEFLPYDWELNSRD